MMMNAAPEEEASPAPIVLRDFNTRNARSAGRAFMTITGLLFAVVIGLLLGLLGGGGSILAVPVFVYVLGIEAKLAIAASLGVVGAASLFGAIPHYRAGNVDLRTALLFAAGSAVGALGGATLSKLVSGSVQLLTFGAVMLSAAVTMLRPRRAEAIEQTSATRSPVMTVLLTVLRGAAVGVLTGFVGVGGGFLIVPALVLLAAMPMKKAVGTSLVVIAINSATGFTGYLLQPEIRERLAAATIGGYPLTMYLIVFTAIAILGSLLGGRLGRRLDAHTLRRAFGVALVAMAAFILVQNAAKIVGE